MFLPHSFLEEVNGEEAFTDTTAAQSACLHKGPLQIHAGTFQLSEWLLSELSKVNESVSYFKKNSPLYVPKFTFSPQSPFCGCFRDFHQQRVNKIQSVLLAACRLQFKF